MTSTALTARCVHASQQEAFAKAHLLPDSPGEMYSPPLQSVTAVNCACRRSFVRYNTALVPLCAWPYL